MSDFDGEEYTDGVNSISFTMPKFKQWRTGRFYDYENQIADYSSLEELNDSIKEARIALFKVNETINQYERKAEEAKVRYGREWRREYMKAADKTDAGKKARADLMCERYEDDMIVNNQVKTELVRLSNSLRLELPDFTIFGEQFASTVENGVNTEMDLAAKDLTKSLRKFVLWTFIIGFLILGSTMLIITEFKISVFSIRGSSMEPTLYSGDTAIIKKGDQIEQGHLVFFTKPEPWTIYGDTGREVPLAKRVGALPGDILSYDGETFKVNGEILYSLDEDKYECTDGEIDYTHVLTNTEFFVVGDNAPESLDSRSIFCKGYTQYMYISENSILNYGKLIKVL